MALMKGQKAATSQKTGSKMLLKTKLNHDNESRRAAMQLAMILIDKGYTASYPADGRTLFVKGMPGGKFHKSDLTDLATQHGFKFDNKCDLIQDKAADGDKFSVVIVLEKISRN